MRVLFDDQIFRNQNFGGISRYFANVISRLKNFDNIKILPSKIYSKNIHLFEHSLSKYGLLQNTPHFRGKSRIDNFFIENQKNNIKKTLSSGKYEIYHPTYYDTEFLDHNIYDKPFVLTVHDMIHELYYDKIHNKIHQETINKQILIPKAAHIIAVSEYTKQDILKLYPYINENKISVVYHGSTIINITKTQNINENYLLFVGNRTDYKNFNWLIISLRPYLIQTGIKLLCAGSNKFTAEEIELINSLGLKKYIFHKLIEDDQILYNLYRNAICFIYPSLYEGFGIPILESFASNCPVILCMASCFPEIAEDGALYYENNNSDQLLTQIQRIRTDKQLRTKMIALGNKRLAFFSWDRTVKIHKDIYLNCIENP